MGDQAIIDTLVGMGMPLVVALLNQSRWSPRVRGLVAVGACAIAATVAGLIRGDLNWSDWRGSAVVILGSALVSYQVWWKPTGVAPVVEAVTSRTAVVERNVD